MFPVIKTNEWRVIFENNFEKVQKKFKKSSKKVQKMFKKVQKKVQKLSISH